MKSSKTIQKQNQELLIGDILNSNINRKDNTNTMRIPRPMGTTELNSTLSKQENKEEQLNKVNQHIINHYIKPIS